MTNKIYKTAQGKSIDLGTIMLQNEHVRAVGNMNVNARGDIVDSNNKVIETKNRRIQKQNSQQTVGAPATIHTSTRAAKRAQAAQSANSPSLSDTIDTPVTPVQNAVVNTPEPNIVTAPAPVEDIPAAGGGLAAAIARSKIVKQEKEKTARQLQQSTLGVRKI